MEAQEFFGDWCEVIDFDILNPILDVLGAIIQSKEISPAPEDIFNAFGCCPYSKLTTVILGIDPYPQKGIGTGIAFANHKGTPESKYSPSLKILYNAVEKYCSDDLPFSYIWDTFPSLERWGKDYGVLLLNSALTTEVGKVGAHSKLWQPFTKSLLTNLQKKKEDTIFVLMGDVAQGFESCVDSKNVIKCPHPARCARTGEEFPDIFNEINRMLKERHKEPVWWY